jgi:hypothetical protein
MTFSTPRPVTEIAAELKALRADSEKIIQKIDLLVHEMRLAILLEQSRPQALAGANRDD